MTIPTHTEIMNERKIIGRKNQRPPSTKKQMPQTKKTVIAKKYNSQVQVPPSKAGGTNDMTKTEARNAIKTIKNSVSSLMETCYELETRNGYMALGYSSFKECVMKELAGVIKYDYAIKMKNAGQVHIVVCPEIPMGEVSEGVLRSLYKLTDAKRKKVCNIAVKKCGDFKKVTEPMLTGIIESEGLAAPVKDRKSKANVKTSIAENAPKYAIDPKIIIKTKLQTRMRLSLLKLLKQDNIENENSPDSKEYFEEALNIMCDDLFDFLSGHYDEIYGE